MIAHYNEEKGQVINKKINEYISRRNELYEKNLCVFDFFNERLDRIM